MQSIKMRSSMYCTIEEEEREEWEKNMGNGIFEMFSKGRKTLFEDI